MKTRSHVSRLLLGSVLLLGVVATPAVAQMPAELDLRTAITYALEHNYAIRQSRERIREQEGLIVEVKGQALPNVGVNGSYTKEDNELAGGVDLDQNWQIALQATQLIYSGGGVRAALDAQDSVREAALQELQSVINNELLRVRTSYYNVLLTREQIVVQEESVKLLEEQLETARNRFDAGTVSQFDVLRAEVELANAQPALIRARNGFRVAIDELRYALGYEETSSTDMQRVPEFTDSLAISPVSYQLRPAIEAARLNRPELLQLDALLEARESGITIAKAGRLPTIAVNGGYALRKDFATDSFSGSRTGWTLGATASWSLWDGDSTNGRIRQALSQKEQARLARLDAGLAVEVEVRRALSELEGATELAEAAVKVVDQAEEAVRLADARYGAGSATQLDVLSAQVALTSARLNLLQAHYSYNVAAATMRRAMGQGDVLIQ